MSSPGGKVAHTAKPFHQVRRLAGRGRPVMQLDGLSDHFQTRAELRDEIATLHRRIDALEEYISQIEYNDDAY